MSTLTWRVATEGTNARGGTVPHDASWWQSARCCACIGWCFPARRAPLNAHASSLAKQNWSPVPAMGESNCGQSPSGNGNTRTIVLSSLCASTSAILIGGHGWNGLRDAVHVWPDPPTQRRPDNADRRVRLEDIRRYVCHGVLWEDDGWVREEEEQTMRHKEVRRTQIWGRGGVGQQWGSPMLGVVRRNSLLERSGGARLTGIWNTWGTQGQQWCRQ